MKHFIAMWDMQGLECLFDVDAEIAEHNAWEKEYIVSILKEQPVSKRKSTIPLQMMILRARVNSQRCYEIYEFNSTMDYNEIKRVFKNDPQPIVEWIRENGEKVYSDYVKQDRKMIV